ncbi:MAG: D-alanyl-D-alanine carboxypeptidase [Clostridiales bacterium]|nr:D-alanyl-D-alanine carboxypeptidase [Clostridiales bacterium]
MNKKILIGIAGILTAIIAFSPIFGKVHTSNAVHAETAQPNLATTCKSAMLLDANTGTVVFEKNTKQHLQIASMVKIMTLSLAFDEIAKREISLDTAVTASENAAAMGGSQAFLDANAQYRLDELLKSIVVASANDSCVAVAEYLYGSVDSFVAAMNERAQKMGLSDTKFVNCTGLPKEGQYSCAADVAVMFKDLMSNEKFFEYAKVWMYDFSHPSGRVTGLTNTNKLIRFYDGCDGGKTGYTDAARSCITVTAKRGDTRLICVAIGAENSKTRNKEVSEMLNYGFANYKTVYAVQKGEVLGEYGVDGGKTDKITAVAQDDFSVFVKCGDKSDVTLQIDIKGLSAPITKGQKVGTVNIFVNGEKCGTVSAVAKNGCQKKGYKDILDDFISEW